MLPNSILARRAASSPRAPGAYLVFGIFFVVKLQFLPHVPQQFNMVTTGWLTIRRPIAVRLGATALI